jgi:hypothetical protein
MTTHVTGAAPEAESEAAEGRVYDVAGQDWDQVVTAGDTNRAENEQIVVNMGPPESPASPRSRPLPAVGKPATRAASPASPAAAQVRQGSAATVGSPAEDPH